LTACGAKGSLYLPSVEADSQSSKSIQQEPSDHKSEKTEQDAVKDKEEKEQLTP